MQQEWDIKSRAHSCARTGREFSEGEFFYTLLFRDGDGFRREDLSEESWQSRDEKDQPFSFWRSRYEPPAPPAPEPLPENDAEGLLRRLISEQNPAHAKASYILALMLERKRILRPVESQDPDTLVYEHIASGDTFVIPNPRLSLAQIPEVQREVIELLSEA